MSPAARGRALSLTEFFAHRPKSVYGDRQSMPGALPFSHRILLDGGIGTSLIAQGLDLSVEPPEMWNLTRPDAVIALHRRFFDAGADAILTNSFGANRLRLAQIGCPVRPYELARTAARLARESAPDGGLVFGSIGPTSQLPPPDGNTDLIALEDAFAEQAAALAEGGVDLLCVETMAHPKEARAALRGCRLGAAGLPVVLSMTVRRHGDHFQTTLGFAAETMLSVATEERAEGVGVNCGLVPGELCDLVALLARSGLPVFAKPTIAPDGGPPLYPDELARGFRALYNAGACAVGGCCGTGPADIAAAKLILEVDLTPPRPFSAAAAHPHL